MLVTFPRPSVGILWKEWRDVRGADRSQLRARLSSPGSFCRFGHSAVCSRFNTDALFPAAGMQKLDARRPVFKFWLHHLPVIGPLHAGPFLGRQG